MRTNAPAKTVPWRRPLFACLMLISVALAPLFHLWAANAAQVSPEDVIRPAALTLVLAVTLLAALRHGYGDTSRAALAAALLILSVLTFGHQLRALDIDSQDQFGSIAMLGANVIGLGVLGLAIGRARWNLTELVLFVGVAASLMNTIAVGTIATTPRSSGTSLRDMPIVADTRASDIYYIVLDGYARPDVLENLYGFDDTEFVEYLESQGFYVASESYANYAHTQLSLASALNLRYVDELPATLSGNVIHLIEPLLRDPRIVDELQTRGYRYAHLETVWWGTASAPLADIRLVTADSEFEAVYRSMTMLDRLLPAPTWQEDHVESIRRVADIAGLPDATFTFAHILLPHPPFVFTPDGAVTRRDAALGGDWEDVDGHLAQVAFVNTLLRELIDEILSASSANPIIILQSDHGPGWAIARDRELGEWERMAILNAYLVPPNIEAALYPEITPVNTFRVILDAMFQTDMPLLTDRVMFSWPQMQESFIDVTERVRARDP